MTIALKCMEIAAMGLATAGLALGKIEIPALALFLLSTQAALFGPSRYGLLPELLPESRLSWGNGILELDTFLAAITGTLAAGLLAQTFRGRQIWSGTIFLVISLAGLATSAGISRANALGDVWMQIREIGRDRLLRAAVVGNTFFWFLASLLLLNVVLYAVDVRRVDEAHSSYLLAGLSLGIGVGSVVAGYLSERRIEYGLVPIGMMGIAAVCAVLALPQLRYSSVTICLAVLGLFGGLFAMPLNALIQHRPEPAQRGGIIAAAVDRPTRFLAVPDKTSSAAIAAALRSREYVCLMCSDPHDARESARVVQDACGAANLGSATLIAVRIERDESSRGSPLEWPPLWRGVSVRLEPRAS